MSIEALLSTQIIDTTTVGRAVMTAVDAAAARTALGLGTLSTQNGTITDYLTTATAATTYQPLDADLTALAALSGTNNIYYRSAANTWTSVTIGTGLTFTGGTLAASGSGITGTTGTTANRLMWTTNTDGVVSNAYNTGTFSGGIQIYDGLSGPGLRLPAGTASNAVGFESQSGGILRLIGNNVSLANNQIQSQYPGTNNLQLGASDNGQFIAGAGSNATAKGFWRGAGGLHIQGGTFGLTTASSCHVYNTYTSDTSLERVSISWASNVCTIATEAGSAGGTLRGLRIGSASTSLVGFFGVTPVDQPATVADPTGGGTIDAEARTAINALIDRLQELGLIT